MRNLFLAFAALAMSVLLFSCDGKKSADAAAENDSTAVVSVANVDSLLLSAETLVGKNVTLSGLCTHICSHGGKKMFLMGSNDSTTIRVESNEEIGAFSKDVVNSMVQVTGKLVEERIDEAYLVNWEAEIAAETADKHGEGDGGAGCETEKKAQGEKTAKTGDERIANFRKRIEAEKAKTGKEYLSFYHIVAESYKIL